MSSPADSFFDIWFTITFTVFFIGTLVLTIFAPTNVWPGGIIFPKYHVVCVLTCEIVEIPINGLWGGLINGATYGVGATAAFLVVRSIWRKKKK